MLQTLKNTKIKTLMVKGALWRSFKIRMQLKDRRTDMITTLQAIVHTHTHS